jgi:hypothetical protein
MATNWLKKYLPGKQLSPYQPVITGNFIKSLIGMIIDRYKSTES